MATLELHCIFLNSQHCSIKPAKCQTLKKKKKVNQRKIKSTIQNTTEKKKKKAVRYWCQIYWCNESAMCWSSCSSHFLWLFKICKLSTVLPRALMGTYSQMACVVKEVLDWTEKRNLFNIPISKCQEGVIQSDTERWAEQNTIYSDFS